MTMEDMNKQLLDRREFGGLCAALGSSLPAVSAMLTGLSGASAFAAATGTNSNVAGRLVTFRGGTVVPAQAPPAAKGWEEGEPPS